MFRYFLVLCSFLSVSFLTSCSYKKEIIYIETDKPILAPQEIIISVSEAPKGILYYSPAQLYSKSNSSNPNIFIAKGLGGLGAMLDDYNNTLTGFEGLKISLSQPVSATQMLVNLTTSSLTNNDICKNLFYFNRENLTISIQNSESINSLIECGLHLNIQITKDNLISKYENDFSFTFNLTFKDYANANDPLVNSLLVQLKMDDVNKLIAWLTRFENSSSLVLKPTEFLNKIEHLNALTGLSHLTLLDVSHTNVKSLKALAFLPHLNDLNVSNTLVSAEELANLSHKTTLTKLNVSNLNLKDVYFLENNFEKLIKLDLSNNEKLFNNLRIRDLDALSNLKTIYSLDISNTGLKNFSQLVHLTNLQTLTELNLSKNDLSTLDNTDRRFLKSLVNLEKIDVSESDISAYVINDIFQSFTIGEHFALKTFIYRSGYLKNNPQNYSCERRKGGFIQDIDSLNLPSNLETIDFHGQSCILHGKEYGLVNTDIFKNVKSLVNLNISSTAVRDFSGLKDLPALKNLIIADEDGGIAMTKSGCKSAKASLIPQVNIFSCDLLMDPTKVNQIFNYSPNEQIFIVPENVWNLTISGCSGANGGAGGGAGGALGYAPASGKNGYYGAHGGNSGHVNGLANLYTEGGLTPFTGKYLYEPSVLWTMMPADVKQIGGNGGVGSSTRITNKNGTNYIQFSNASGNIANASEKCIGGVNGTGGASISSYVNIGRSGKSQPENFRSGAGAKNNYPAWSSEVQIYENLPVIPGQTFKISIGKGGAAGKGGTPEHIIQSNGIPLDGRIPQPSENKSYRGNPGFDGTPGANGFVKIEWDSGI